MSDVSARCLDTFPQWLRTLGSDAEALVALVGDQGVPDGARRAIAGGLNYLFKSLDLIPDGIDDIGYLDDAFVLRVAVKLASSEDLAKLGAEQKGPLERLGKDSELIAEFLGDNYARLETYVAGLRRGAARGRSVDDIMGDAHVLGEFTGDVRAFARGYQPPSFAREEKNLIKMKAFFDAKLPK
ncbi:MAG: DUF1232 domain-containing protein [Deltaproteobacteria bacterium]|nr:DUF1232 domain-containing protein [Deltaproteobacteria bacterium]